MHPESAGAAMSLEMPAASPLCVPAAAALLPAPPMSALHGAVR
jgi:hypothetical protein